MAGDESVAQWIAQKLTNDQQFGIVRSIGSGFLEIARTDGAPFIAAAIGVRDIVTRDHVAPLFAVSEKRPEFVVNVPSKVIWKGDAINLIHEQPAAFGTFGEMIKASFEERVHIYRHRECKFFEQAFRQHTSVTGVTRLYDRLFQLHRARGLPDITVVLIDAYDMSAEDVRTAREKYGKFDAAVKISSYGAVTTAAWKTAKDLGAEAFTFGELMSRLNRR